MVTQTGNITSLLTHSLKDSSLLVAALLQSLHKGIRVSPQLLSVHLIKNKLTTIAAQVGLKLQHLLLVAVFHTAAKILPDTSLPDLHKKFLALSQIAKTCHRRLVPMVLIDLIYI